MQGVESMGSALEVSPSAFGGFTIREDFVSAMRLSIRHTQSMPAEGKPDSDLQALTVIKAYTLLSYAAPCSDAIRSHHQLYREHHQVPFQDSGRPCFKG